MASAPDDHRFTDNRGNSPRQDQFWLELLRDGLTFDLLGLAPGEAAYYPEPQHRFDVGGLPRPGDFEALLLAPSHHLSGAGNSTPVSKALFSIARDLVNHFGGAHSVIWPPSSSVIGKRFFDSTVTAWIDGGPFPALGLTAFTDTANEALQSVGLGYWIGQELHIESPLSSDKVAATRLGVRLVNHLLMVGGVESDERIVGPDGSRLVLRLSRNGRFIRVLRE